MTTRWVGHNQKETIMASGKSTACHGVVIIGAGHSGGRASERLRHFGYMAKITLIGKEGDAPYERPPLSKGVLLTAGSETDTFLFENDWYSQNDITLMTNSEVIWIDRLAQSVVLSCGTDVPYDSLIIATGGRLRHLNALGADLKNILYLKTMKDAKALREKLNNATRLVVVGGGFIGLEVAASARSLGADVTVIEAADRLMGRAVPKNIGDLVAKRHAERGIKIVLGKGVECLQGVRAVEQVVLSDGGVVVANLVVVGVGILPEAELAERAGLLVENGIVVNDLCKTSDPAIYAIGDVACRKVAPNSCSFRTESWQNAEAQAALVAAAITDQEAPECEPPWFWSDQDNMNLQIVGQPLDWDNSITRGTPGEGPFLMVKMDGNHPVGAISINAKREMLLMRKLLKAKLPIDRDALSDEQTPLKKTVLSALKG